MIDLPPPGFQGLRPDLPVTMYRRHLPHWRQEGATYFVTFRLADSLPRERLAELRAERDAWSRTHPDSSDEERDALVVDQMRRIEGWLDAGYGQCVLRSEVARESVAGSLLRFDDDRYLLGAFAILSNHVHVVVRPKLGWSLERLDGDWKRQSAKCLNAMWGRHGSLWQGESFDRIVRDADHLRRVLKYVAANPAKAGGIGMFWERWEWAEWSRSA